MHREDRHYEIDDKIAIALDRVRAKNPNAMVYRLRIGFASVHQMGIRRVGSIRQR